MRFTRRPSGRVLLTRAQSDSAADDPFRTFAEWDSPADTEPMRGFEIWNLVKVPFPYTNRPVQQQRPALIVAVPVAQGVNSGARPSITSISPRSTHGSWHERSGVRDRCRAIVRLISSMASVSLRSLSASSMSTCSTPGGDRGSGPVPGHEAGQHPFNT